jgi:8-amino-7-oxononanoate synthase
MTVPTRGRDAWRHTLQQQLDDLRDNDLLRGLHPADGSGRVVRLDGRDLINLASNDYLGLSQHPHLKHAAIAAIERSGVGSGASRLVAGTLREHAQIEQRFAAFKHAEAALLCPTGYMANLAVLCSLAGPGDLICLDKLTHASLIDAARASGATVRTFPHLGYARLEHLLSQAEGRAFIVTDSVFSMDGDTADLPVLCDVAERCGAMLIVDEAHGTGVFGDTGAGLCEMQGVADRVDVVVSTASKALGGLGGVITGDRVVIDTIVNRGRSFIFTTAPPPAQAAALDAALDIVRDEPWRRARVLDLARRCRSALSLDARIGTPILPLVTGTAASALALADRLREADFLAVAIRPPTVAPNTARVRLSLRADLDDDDITRLLDALGAS